YREATIELRDDGTATSASTVVWNAGQPRGNPVTRTPGAELVLWSDQIPSTIDDVIGRARAMGIAAGDSAFRIPATSLYRDTHAFVTVERIDATDWRLSSGGKRYDVLTDAEGRMLSATLPDYGVTIERRIGFMPAAYPPWPAYAPPPDGAYRADSVRIAAPEGHSLAATLTVPKRAGPFAAAVLVTGISPHERNQG